MKAKRLPKKRYKEKESGFSKYGHEIIGILILVLGILVLLSFYFENSVGIFGTSIKGLILGLVGLPAFVVPLLIIVYGVFKIFNKVDDIFKLRVLYTIILLLIISSLIQSGYYDPNNYVNMSPWSCITSFYKEGGALKGGGVFGGIIGMPLILVFRVLGTIIILTALSVIDIILLTNISIANFARNLKGFLINRYKAPANEISRSRRDKKLKVPSESETIGEDDDLVIEFKPNQKVIDINIERTARELKEKTNSGSVKKLEKPEKIEKIEKLEKVEVEGHEIEPVQFIMKDLKKKTGSGVSSIKDSINMEKEIAMHDSIIKDYSNPPFDLLNESTEDGTNIRAIKNAALEGAKKLEDTLKSFGVEAKVINISRGPAVTRYELQPSPGVKVSKIVNLSDDIALNLAATGVRIEAPIPGKAAVGIEVPNKEVTAVLLREVIESHDFVQFPSKLAFAIGKDISGDTIVGDIAKMPHLLIAGATGSGKSVCINSLIISLLYKSSPDEVKLLMVDPKVVELGIYNGIPHLLIPVVTDPKKAAGALNWAVQEMVNRYKLFADKGARDLKGYNAMLKVEGEEKGLPQIVIIIDELADLMMVAPHDVEDAICRLAQMARAAGMHLVIATQRPSVDVITGVIKANIPSRISFAVSSQIDSRTILDMAGAEKLLGKGDMLFYPIGQPKPIRVKGAFVSDKEVEKVIEYIKNQGNAEYNNDIIEELNNENEPADNKPSDKDEFLSQAIELVVESGQASVSLIQRKFKVGYARAARIVDQMEERGVVGGYEGSKPRQVLMNRQQLQELQLAGEK